MNKDVEIKIENSSMSGAVKGECDASLSAKLTGSIGSVINFIKEVNEETSIYPEYVTLESDDKRYIITTDYNMVELYNRANKIGRVCTVEYPLPNEETFHGWEKAFAHLLYCGVGSTITYKHYILPDGELITGMDVEGIAIYKFVGDEQLSSELYALLKAMMGDDKELATQMYDTFLGQLYP